MFLKYFPVIFGAFVEQDDKQMIKKRKFEQMSVLSAGVFANILTAILFFIILGIFFSFAFAPAGVAFDTYSYSPVNISSISMVNGMMLTSPSYENIMEKINETGLNKIKSGNSSYLITKTGLENQKDNFGYIIAYDDAPAINANLSDIITEINGIKIDNLEKLKSELEKYQAGEEITVTEKTGSGFLDKKLVLEENPSKPGAAWLGIGFYEKNDGKLKKIIYTIIFSFKNPNIYYHANWELSQFFYDLFWWIIIINLFVGLFNMLPMGIFDGGRFFYLTILKITKSKRTAKTAFKLITWLFLLLFFILMLRWIFIFFN